MIGDTTYASSLKATRFGLSGHSGTLYLPHKRGQKPQTTGQSAFHDRLRVLFDAHKDPAAYIGGLIEVVRTDLWDGVIDFLPKALRGHHHRIEMDYTGAAGGGMEPDLEAFGARIRRSYNDLDTMLGNVSLSK